MAEFSRRIEVIANAIVDNTARAVRKAALVVDQVAVMSTPVDTGRARANWLTSVGAPAEGTPHGGRPEGDPGAAAAAVALEQGRQAVAEYKLSDGSIYVVNNLDYIDQLDKGSSQQAPAGMSAQAVAAGTAVLRGEKVLP